jgi:Lipase maturation factor
MDVANVPELLGNDYQIARFLLERGLGAIYLIAFAVAYVQFPALCGERGLEPAPRWLAVLSFRSAPSIFQWRYSDRLLCAVSVIGVLLAALVIVGLASAAPLPITMAVWFTLWVLYQSIVNVGGTFYGFGWETLLLEAGFLAVFLGNAESAPLFPVLLLFRWLAFRVEFGAGLIKLRGDPCWRDLSCMDYHHETQPMPNLLSWYAHRAPRWWHRVEAMGNWGAQLVLPFFLFLPQPIATIAAALMIASQLYLVVTGNYAWLNWITIVAMTSGLSDSAIRTVLPFLGSGAELAPPPGWFVLGVGLLVILIVVLSYWPVRNLLSRHQAMNASFDPFHLVNTYGAFGSVTRARYEVVVEGTIAERAGAPDAEWREYEFKGKPNDVRRIPPQVAPYHLRLDWLMWFIPLSPGRQERWFVLFLTRLLEADRPTLRLLRRDPFDGEAPRYLRARLFRYRFTTRAERRETGAWWTRTEVGTLVPPIGRGGDTW